MVKLQNPIAISSSFIIIGVVLFIIGYFVYRKPEKVIGMRFVRGFGGYNLSDMAFWKSYEKRYGREKAIKNMKTNGLVLMIFGAVNLVFGVLKFFL